MSSPVVSVLMTVYNGMPYLKDAVESILNQTLRDIELVVVDDGSTDNSLSYVSSLNDSRIKVIQGGRLGRGRALNLGLKNCTGKYVAINDADDVSHLERLEKQYTFLEENRDYVLIGSLSYFQDHGTGKRVLHKERPLNYESIKMALTKGQPIQHVTVLMRQEALTAIGGYNERIKFLFDRDLFVRLGKLGKLANLPEPLVDVGHHENRFFYFTYKGFQREYLSLVYRIKAINQFGFPKWWILREVVRSLWSAIPIRLRRLFLATLRLRTLFGGSKK